jgi:hypothetical protein
VSVSDGRRLPGEAAVPWMNTGDDAGVVTTTVLVELELRPAPSNASTK